MGRVRHRGSDQRGPPSADFVPPVQAMPALLLAKLGPLQGKVSERPGERVQADVEVAERVVDQQPRLREALKTILNGEYLLKIENENLLCYLL